MDSGYFNDNRDDCNRFGDGYINLGKDDNPDDEDKNSDDNDDSENSSKQSLTSVLSNAIVAEANFANDKNSNSKFSQLNPNIGLADASSQNIVGLSNSNISVNISGSGSTAYMNLQLSNNSDSPLVIQISQGSVLNPGNSSSQIMMIR